MFGKLLEWLRMPVDEVPEEIAVCEFECGRTECRLGDWRCCERRLQNPGREPRDALKRPH
jgi:hypothetical protein